METLETRLRVRYAETDQMGVVYYANYLIWMEVGRAELCRATGIRYRDMEIDDDVMLVVAEANCRYLAPARYDDEVAVRTTIGDATPRMVRFDYEVRRAQWAEPGHRVQQACVLRARHEAAKVAAKVLAAVRHSLAAICRAAVYIK